MKRLISVLVVLCLLVGAVFGVSFGSELADRYYAIYQKYLAEAKDVVLHSSPLDFARDGQSKVYASDGTELATLSSDASSMYLTYQQLPKDVINATIAIEDNSFFKHKGVNWKSTAKAAMEEVLTHGNSSRGGSTITQQLVKNTYLSFERSYERKAKEILIAQLLEKKYSKEQILEYYVNNINYANLNIGIGSASMSYYHKPLRNCSLAEIALLVGVPNNPTLYNPITNYENALKRKDVILHEMYECGFIGSREYCQALNEKPVISKMQKRKYDYEVSYAVHCAVLELMRNSGFNFKYSFDSDKEYESYYKHFHKKYSECESVLHKQSYTIKTSINRNVQKEVQSYVDIELKEFKKKAKDGQYDMQGAVTVVDNQSHKVVACVGGRSNKADFYSFNRAYQSYLQPGSTIKPILVYTPAIELGMRPNSVVSDVKVKDGPRNADGQYSGSITLRTAVEKSKNAVAWNVFNQTGVKRSMKYLEKMHFSHITASDYNLASALGGFTHGVNTTEMAAAYSTLANNGLFTEATCIVDILDSSGTSIYKSCQLERVYTEKSAQYMTDILQGVAVNGTARGLVLSSKTSFACKTGTTNDYKCAWFCGYTPRYSVAVYVGSDSGRKTQGLSGATYPKFIWQDTQEYLCQTIAEEAFNLYAINSKVSTHETVDISHVGETGYVSEPTHSTQNVKINPSPSPSSNSSSSSSSSKELEDNKDDKDDKNTEKDKDKDVNKPKPEPEEQEDDDTGTIQLEEDTPEEEETTDDSTSEDTEETEESDDDSESDSTETE